MALAETGTHTTTAKAHAAATANVRMFNGTFLYCVVLYCHDQTKLVAALTYPKRSRCAMLHATGARARSRFSTHQLDTRSAIVRAPTRFPPDAKDSSGARPCGHPGTP